jgi:hypothetical protein
MASSSDRDGLSEHVVSPRFSFFQQVRNESVYLTLLAALFIVAALVYEQPRIAMWFGFMLAGYSAIANDSIQTIGTFIASNQKRPWWILWLFIGGVFVLTILDSLRVYDGAFWAKPLAIGSGELQWSGDVSHDRLAAKGFSEAPQAFEYLQLAAPIFLLILTRLRVPVSTSFLILTCFATDPEGITSMLGKSLSGYGVAFGVALIVWFTVTRALEGLIARRPTPRPFWVPLQWVSTGFLWSQWIAQDAANIAVYLPREMSGGQATFFIVFIFVGLALLFYLRGDRIQEIVTEKSDVYDVRAATLIDFVYALVLYYFKELNNVPMSTTWVFLGLLAGREVAITIASRRANKRSAGQTALLIGRDIGYAGIGLIVSIAIAWGVNPEIVSDIFG